MTDGEKARLKDISQVFALVVCRAQQGSDKWVMATGIVSLCEYLLDNPDYRDDFELMLRAIREELGTQAGMDRQKDKPVGQILWPETFGG